MDFMCIKHKIMIFMNLIEIICSWPLTWREGHRSLRLPFLQFSPRNKRGQDQLKVPDQIDGSMDSKQTDAWRTGTGGKHPWMLWHTGTVPSKWRASRIAPPCYQWYITLYPLYVLWEGWSSVSRPYWDLTALLQRKFQRHKTLKAEAMNGALSWEAIPSGNQTWEAGKSHVNGDFNGKIIL